MRNALLIPQINYQCWLWHLGASEVFQLNYIIWVCEAGVCSLEAYSVEVSTKQEALLYPSINQV